MFFTLILENSDGELVDMTTTADHYMTLKISGLHPPPGTVSTSAIHAFYYRRPAKKASAHLTNTVDSLTTVRKLKEKA